MFVSPSEHEVRSVFWLGVPESLQKTLTGYENLTLSGEHVPTARRIARMAGVTAAEMLDTFKRRIILNAGYYYDSDKSHSVSIVVWFKLELLEIVKKDYVERPVQGRIKDPFSTPKYFQRYLNSAEKIVQATANQYALGGSRELIPELAKKMIHQLHEEIMNEWLELD